MKRAARASSGRTQRREAGDASAGDGLTYLDAVGSGGMMGGRGGSVASLTGRACDPLRDVVHYRFEVIISSTELPRLFRNLMLQNCHTVVDVELAAPAATQEDRRMGGRMGQTQTGMYYYGTEHVVRATITGEAQLLSSWTRGRWDEKARDWDKEYPPLMPVDFLQRIAQSDTRALRKEDTQRLTAAGKMPTAADEGPRVGAPRPAAGQPYSREGAYDPEQRRRRVPP
jgi:hypothetical protein